MEEIVKHINNAYEIIESMLVNGKNQDLCSAAKLELRLAYQEAENATKDKTDE